jgi:phosphoribosylformylglycinamidine cyclo-ligase
MGESYRDAGVDIEEARRAVDLIARAAAATATPAVMGGVGGFGSLFRFDPTTHPDPVLVASTDGVGTKLKLAVAMERYDSIGIDLVHHCINDIAVQGADPLFFLDYLAVGRLRAEVAAEIVTGIANACAAAGVALVGGETAELPDLYRGDDFDLAGFIVGVVSGAVVIDGSQVREGDLLLGVPSSGLHTNGYSLARRVFSEDDWSRSAPGLDGTIGEALLAPHRDYLDEIRILRRALRAAGGDTLAFAHITGGGWVDNIPRTLPIGLGVSVELGSWPVPMIFSLIQERGDIADDEMVRAFNLGIGLTCVIRPEHEAAARAALPEALPVGRVVATAPGSPRVTFA